MNSTFKKIHWFIDGHLGWFHILTTGNNAAINIDSCSTDWFHSFRYILRTGIAKSHGSSIFNYLGKLILFLMVIIYIPTSSIQGFPNPHILSNIYYVLSFLFWTFYRYFVVVLICISLMIRNRCTFLYTGWYLYVLFENASSGPLHILKLGF